MRKKILYSDVPRPYDAEAKRLVVIVGLVLVACFLLTVFLSIAARLANIGV